MKGKNKVEKEKKMVEGFRRDIANKNMIVTQAVFDADNDGTKEWWSGIPVILKLKRMDVHKENTQAQDILCHITFLIWTVGLDQYKM